MACKPLHVTGKEILVARKEILITCKALHVTGKALHVTGKEILVACKEILVAWKEILVTSNLQRTVTGLGWASARSQQRTSSPATLAQAAADATRGPMTAHRFLKYSPMDWRRAIRAR